MDPIKTFESLFSQNQHLYHYDQGGIPDNIFYYLKGKTAASSGYMGNSSRTVELDKTISSELVALGASPKVAAAFLLSIHGRHWADANGKFGIRLDHLEEITSQVKNGWFDLNESKEYQTVGTNSRYVLAFEEDILNDVEIEAVDIISVDGDKAKADIHTRNNLYHVTFDYLDDGDKEMLMKMDSNLDPDGLRKWIIDKYIH
jgi:hypothetical protein